MAIVAATGLTLADRWVFTVLLTTADWGTAFLPDRFQPGSLIKLAEKCQVSKATVKRSVGHLQRHGWLERHRNLTDNGIGGRGHPTRYVLNLGRSCDCSKGAHSEPVSEQKGAHDEPGKGLRGTRVSAGQVPVSTGRAVAGGSREGKAETEYRGGPVSWDQDDVDEWMSQQDD